MRKRNYYAGILSFFLVLNGCSLFGEREVPSDFDLNHRVSVIDEKTGEPINGASVLVLKNDKLVSSKLTSERGVAHFKISGTPTIEGRHVYLTMVAKIKVEKEGYIQAADEAINIRSQWRYGQPNNIIGHDTVKLFNPLSYTCNELVDKSGLKTAKKIATWMKFDSSNEDVNLVSICEDELRGERYLSIRMASKHAFNSNVLSEYDVAKRMFTSVILEYLKSDGFIYPSESGAHGLKFSVLTSISDFTDRDSSSGKKLKFDFYISEQGIQGLFDKTLSRQKLVDSSVVLINGDLIDLELQ